MSDPVFTVEYEGPTVIENGVETLLAPGARLRRIDGRDVWWCEEHRAAIHQPEGVTELRCDVWVVAGLDGFVVMQPCRMKQVRIIDMPEEET